MPAVIASLLPARIAAQVLAERLAHGSLPAVVEHFLSRVWRPSVQQVALRVDAGPALDAAIAVGDAVLAQLTPARGDTALDARRAALLEALPWPALGRARPSHDGSGWTGCVCIAKKTPSTARCRAWSTGWTRQPT
ncbi:hypothetical protein ACCQ06_05275 [Xanthomonas sp. NCPPB 4467]